MGAGLCRVTGGGVRRPGNARFGAVGLLGATVRPGFGRLGATVLGGMFLEPGNAGWPGRSPGVGAVALRRLDIADLNPLRSTLVMTFERAGLLEASTVCPANTAPCRAIAAGTPALNVVRLRTEAGGRTLGSNRRVGVNDAAVGRTPNGPAKREPRVGGATNDRPFLKSAACDPLRLLKFPPPRNPLRETEVTPDANTAFRGTNPPPER